MPPRRPKLILASRSPQRRQLLAAAGYEFEIVPPLDVDECGICSRKSPAELVARLALEKASDVAVQVGQGLILACDTVAECDGQVLGKPENESLARRMLEMLSGREHRVLSGVCLWKLPERDPLIRIAMTRLKMDHLSPADLAAYVESWQWEGKAGGFGYQDRLGWVKVLEGSESNVIGLPMELLGEMIEQIAKP
ncbi:MAG TPA: Maf family protein [Pirellulales bacterium]|nr:Maf family protein [Pirellulales bacterium]